MTNIKSLKTKLEFTRKKKTRETKVKLKQAIDHINQKSTDLISLILNAKKKLINRIKEIENNIENQLNEISLSSSEIEKVTDENLKDTHLNEQDLELLIFKAISFKSDLEAKINRVNVIQNNYEFETARFASEWNGDIGNIEIKDISVRRKNYIRNDQHVRILESIDFQYS
jgi:hypothetical protein